MASNRIPGSPPSSVPGAPSRVPGYRLGFNLGAPSVQGALTRVPVTLGSKPYEKAHRQQLKDTSGRYAGGFGVAWQGLTRIDAKMLKLEKDTAEALVEAGNDLGKQMVEWAQQHHLWKNRTGDAEANLQYYLTFERDETMSIWLAHGGGGNFGGKNVPYGLWLEVRWGGKFAILLPTLDHFRQQIGNITADHLKAHIA
jgi:hypothetical protein